MKTALFIVLFALSTAVFANPATDQCMKQCQLMGMPYGNCLARCM